MYIFKTMNEKWIKLEHYSIPKGKYEITRIIQDFHGTRIELDNQIVSISISFENPILSLRICDEGDRLRTINSVLENEGGRFFTDWPIYTVVDSKFSEWLEDETFQIRKRDTFKHYAVVTPNDIVDILSIEEPKINVSIVT